MIQQFHTLNLQGNATRITAVTPSQLQDYSITLPPDVPLDHITPEEYCCTLSHLRAIRTAWFAGDEVALILEDDMRIIRYPDSQLLETAPDGWEILQMMAMGDLAVQNMQKAEQWVPWCAGLWSTGAYIINRAGMIRVLDQYAPHKQQCRIDFSAMCMANPRARAVADWALYVAANTFSNTDVFFTEDPGDSTIKQEDIPLHQHTLQAIEDKVATGCFKWP